MGQPHWGATNLQGDSEQEELGTQPALGSQISLAPHKVLSAVCVQLPPGSLQLSRVQATESLHAIAVPATQWPPTQLSLPVQASPSLQSTLVAHSGAGPVSKTPESIGPESTTLVSAPASISVMPASLGPVSTPESGGGTKASTSPSEWVDESCGVTTPESRGIRFPPPFAQAETPGATSTTHARNAR